MVGSPGLSPCERGVPCVASVGFARDDRERVRAVLRGDRATSKGSLGDLIEQRARCRRRSRKSNIRGVRVAYEHTGRRNEVRGWLGQVCAPHSWGSCGMLPHGVRSSACELERRPSRLHSVSRRRSRIIASRFRPIWRRGSTGFIGCPVSRVACPRAAREVTRQTACEPSECREPYRVHVHRRAHVVPGPCGRRPHYRLKPLSELFQPLRWSCMAMHAMGRQAPLRRLRHTARCASRLFTDANYRHGSGICAEGWLGLGAGKHIVVPTEVAFCILPGVRVQSGRGASARMCFDVAPGDSISLWKRDCALVASSSAFISSFGCCPLLVSPEFGMHIMFGRAILWLADAAPSW